MKQIDETTEAENNEIENHLEQMVKWSKFYTATSIVIWVCGAGLFVLMMLKEFTDFEEKVPFLYGKIFGGIVLALALPLVVFSLFCYFKFQKYQKQIEKTANEEDGDETDDG